MSNDDVIRALQEHAEKAAASAMQSPIQSGQTQPGDDGLTAKFQHLSSDDTFHHGLAAPTGFAGHVGLFYTLPGDKVAVEFARVVSNGCWIVNWNLTAQVANDTPIFRPATSLQENQTQAEGLLCWAIAQALVAARGNLREVSVEQGKDICAGEYQRLRALWLASLSPEQRAALD